MPCVIPAVDPEVNQAFFSSGWEHAHAVAPVVSGVRYSLNVFFTARNSSGRGDRELPCLRAGSSRAWEACDKQWAERYGEDGE